MDKINKIIIKYLEDKGLREDEIEEFLSPSPKLTYDPFLLKNMEDGVDFVIDKIRQGKKICIFGDYDADGVTSIVILKTVLEYIISELKEEKTSQVSYFVPSRFKDGYGISKEALKKLKEKGVEAIITVDCGAVAYEEVEYCKEIGLEILVTDHHSVGDKELNCIMINPKQEDCMYPFKGLAGCGVAFKLSQGLIEKLNLNSKIIRTLLDILAIGTVADVVPLVDENRTFVKYGLRLMNSNRRKSIARLMEMIDFKKDKIGSEDIAYIIAPHINATGRMEDASIAVEFFLDENNLEKNAKKLISTNNARKDIQENTYEKCVKEIETQCLDSECYIIYAGNSHEGITGIVAGKIKELKNRPTIIVTDTEDGLKGTSRSTDNINIHSLLKKNEDLFVKFGGHKSACGFSMKKENLEELRRRTREDMKKLIGENPLIFSENHKGDIELKTENISLELAHDLEMLEPYGAGNERPKILVKNEKIYNQVMIGKESNHAKFTVGSNYDKVDCIVFSVSSEEEELVFGSEDVYLLGKISINEWNGRRKVQLIVEKIFLENEI